MTLLERFDALDLQLTHALDDPDSIELSPEDSRHAAVALRGLLENRAAAAKESVDAAPSQIAS